MMMRMPEHLFFGGKRSKKFIRDNIFHAHQFSVCFVTVENNRLVYIFVQLAYVMMRLHLSVYVAIVKMKAVQVGTKIFKGCLILQNIGACVQGLILRRFFASRALYVR